MNDIENMSQEEISDLMDTSCNLAIVWSGKLKDLYEVTRFLRERGSYIYYKKSSKDKIYIKVQKEKGEKNENPK